MGRRRKRWQYTAGSKPATVVVEERTPGSMIYGRMWDPSARDGRGNSFRMSLGHRDRELAKQWALEQAAKLRAGAGAMLQGRANLGQVLALYEQHKTPRKSPRVQKMDRARIELWKRWLGAESDPHGVTLRRWEEFTDARSSGVIDARGRAVPEGKRRPVRARAVQADLLWLKWVFNWAERWRLANGHYLMRENPVRGFPTPVEKNVKRPVVSTDRYEAIRAVSDQVMMEIRWNGHRERQRSYLTELLDLVHWTGRRIGAVRQLTFDDLRLGHGPHGCVRWPADTDKQGRETLVPISAQARAALDRIAAERPGIGPVPLFPSPHDPTKPVRYEVTRAWLLEAERLAKVETHRGSSWHAYRRGWATSRKRLPDVDVAAAGGWKSLDALKQCYQMADSATMQAVVDSPDELREAK